MVRVAGLDPSGSSRRASGLAILDDHTVLFVGRVRYDREIMDVILSFRPVVIAIDSPLSHAETYREVDLVMRRMGYRVLPPGWRSMRMLIDRSLRLKKVFEENNIVVIETHPYSALKSSGCNDYDALLSKLGISVPRVLSRDEYDALVAAIVAKYYTSDEALKIEARDGIIYLLPRIC
jgi:predicted nuclease with RNAse H fold